MGDMNNIPVTFYAFFASSAWRHFVHAARVLSRVLSPLQLE